MDSFSTVVYSEGKGKGKGKVIVSLFNDKYVDISQENGKCEGNGIDAGTATADDHLLTESTVSVGQLCRICGRPLLGLVRQGYLCQSMLTLSPVCDIFHCGNTGFPRVLESPGFFLKFPGPGKFRKMSLVLESPGN